MRTCCVVLLVVAMPLAGCEKSLSGGESPGYKDCARRPRPGPPGPTGATGFPAAKPGDALRAVTVPVLAEKSMYRCDRLDWDDHIGIWIPSRTPGPVLVGYAREQNSEAVFQTYRSLEMTPGVCGQVGTGSGPGVETVLWWRYLIGRWPVQTNGNEIAGSPGTCAIMMRSTRTNPSGNVETVERVIALPDPAPPSESDATTVPQPAASTVFVWSASDNNPAIVATTGSNGPLQCVEIINGASPGTLRTIPAGDALNAFVACVQHEADQRNLTKVFPPGQDGLPPH